MLAPNAVRVLDKVIGIESEIRQLGYSFSCIDMYLDGGGSIDKVGAIGIGQSQSQGAGECKGLTIKRPVLHNKLVDLCRQEKLIGLEYGKKLSGIEESEKGVTACFEDGSKADGKLSSETLARSLTNLGDILLGVDGIHSKVREHVLGGPENALPYAPRYTGHVVLGSSIRTSDLPPMSTPMIEMPAFIYTQAGTVLMFPTDHSASTFQWAAFVTAPAREDRKAWTEYQTSGQALRDLRADWSRIGSEPIKSIIPSLTDDSLLLWAPYEIPDLPTWHTDRVCLLGDSCHAISPSAGQGTAQALEDVGLMVRLLSSKAALAKGYPALFAHFEKTRSVRLEHIKRFTQRSLATRYPTSNSWVWWAKRIGYKAFFKVVGRGGNLRDNITIGYDVTAENIVV